MNLLTGKELAQTAGVSAAAITKARKNERLRFYNGTKKYDADDPLNRAFLEIIPKEREQKTAVSNPGTEESKQDPGLAAALTKTQKAQAKKLSEEALLKEEQRIEKQLKNKHRRGELVETQSVNQMIMTFFDSWLNSNKRGFNSSFDEFMRMAFQVFENETQGGKPDFKPHDISRSQVKRKWSNDFESWADDGKHEAVRRLQEMTEGQKK